MKKRQEGDFVSEVVMSAGCLIIYMACSNALRNLASKASTAISKKFSKKKEEPTNNPAS